jgi:Beta-xylosidase
MKNEKFIPKAPLFRDPIYDGAADPTIIWNREKKEWWIFYTNRRAFAPNVGVAFVHGTDIGITVSRDAGREWDYKGIAQGLAFEEGKNTFWAPEVIWAKGKYHMYCSYVKGIPENWERERQIIHYVSQDLYNWEYQGAIKLSSDRVIDACVYEVKSGYWKMWYKDERDNSHTWAAKSYDLENWQVLGAEITDCPHEGPNVFQLAGYLWMITDPWDGLGVYCSKDSCVWERKDNILKESGQRTDDTFMASHADVLICDDKAYIFYFVHPEMTLEIKNGENPHQHYEQRRSSLQVAELVYDGNTLRCERNKAFYLDLKSED